LKYLEDQDLSFLQSPFDHFGRSNAHNIKSYRGPLPEYNKQDGLEPYKYSIAIEAVAERNYVTEKFFDCILCECLPFYWGCPNMSDWFDPDCYVTIDPFDKAKSYTTIRDAIRAHEWERRLPAIRTAKRKILDEYNCYAVLEQTIRRLQADKGRRSGEFFGRGFSRYFRSG
jgi:hypothetical protein